MSRRMNMTSIFAMWKLFEKREFKEANENKRIKMFYDEYARTTETKFYPDWKEKWEMSEPLVRQLVSKEFKTTEFLLTRTNWRGNYEYNYQLLNLEKIRHNPEIITLWLAIQSIWGYKDCRDSLSMKSIGYNYDSQAIKESVDLFYSEHLNMVPIINYDVVQVCTVRYFDLISYNSSENEEAFYNGTTTRTVKAIVL